MARKHLYLVRTDIPYERRDDLAALLEREHLAAAAQVPGVERASLFVNDVALHPRYMLAYELTDAGIVHTAQWKGLTELGQWASEVAPHLMNQQEALYAPASGGQDLTHRTRALFWVMMDVEPHREGLMGEVYDTEHVPALMAVPGAVSAVRFTTRDPGHPRYLAIYEGEPAELFSSDEWTGAGEVGRWPTEVRPYTYNKRWILAERAATSSQ